MTRNTKTQSLRRKLTLVALVTILAVQVCAAIVLTRFTGSPFFPGGIAIHDSPAGTGLGFESGPSRNTQLQWATYFDAADQAGLSRLYGGIHISADDLNGRKMAAKVGDDAYDRFLLYYTGITPGPVVTPRPLAGSGSTVGSAPTGSTSTTTTTPAVASPASGGSGGGGGGAPSAVFFWALLVLTLARGITTRSRCPRPAGR